MLAKYLCCLTVAMFALFYMTSLVEAAPITYLILSIDNDNGTDATNGTNCNKTTNATNGTNWNNTTNANNGTNGTNGTNATQTPQPDSQQNQNQGNLTSYFEKWSKFYPDASSGMSST
ncbi:hypothetical protein QCA50_016131 [Cerrena zonata]|uniref:Secreted protein n=1 Tax=Cerrena zonata TaxID=2478898 RepID=A0AAW0FTW5_9APHY